MRKAYFDNAATTQPRAEVISRMTTCLSANYGNPSSVHSFGRSSKTLLEQARKNIAKYMGAHPSEVIFTSGGTEADNMILHSAVRDLKVRHVITSKMEHHAVLHTVEALAQQYAIAVTYVQFSVSGQLDHEHLEGILARSSEKTLVALMHINNEVGTLLDMDRVGELCQHYKALFHSDMVQSVGRYALDLSKIPVDFAAASAHKFHGPKGVGFAYIRKHSGLRPLLFGGEQERGYRGGTEGVHNVIGMEEALRLAYEHLEQESMHIMAIKDYFVQQLRAVLPQVTFNANSDSNSANSYTMVNVALPITPEKATIILFHLDINGVACSRGSACQSGSIAVSHVLQELLNQEALQNTSLRFSFSKYNTMEEVAYVIKVLKEFVAA